MSTNSVRRFQAARPHRPSEPKATMRMVSFHDHLRLDEQKSMRRYDDNGYLHVKRSPLTREQVAEYLGRELPEFPNLDPDKIYKVYRPGSELAKPNTIQSIQNIPIQFEHHQEDPRNPPNDTRVGSCGTDGAWQAPFLVNSLVFYDARAIARIEDGSMRELSLGYTCNISYEPGKTAQGESYEFIMRDITANHLALVEEGRAGPNVRVLDNKPSQGVKLMDEQRQADLLATVQKMLALLQPQGAASQDQEQELEASDDEEMPEELAAEPDATEEQAPDDFDEETLPSDDVDLDNDAALGDEEEDVKDEECSDTDNEDGDREESNDDSEPVNDEEKQALADAGITNKAQKAYFLEFWRARPRTSLSKMKQDSKDKMPKYSRNQLERYAKQKVAKALGDAAKLQSAKSNAYDKAVKERQKSAVSKALAAMQALNKACEDVRPIVGTLKASSFSRAGDVYRYALKQKGLKYDGLSAEAARASFLAYVKGLETLNSRRAKKADAALAVPQDTHNQALAKIVKHLV